MQQNQVMSAQEIDLSEAHQAFVLVDQAKNALESVTEHHGIDPDDLSRLLSSISHFLLFVLVLTVTGPHASCGLLK